MSVWLSADGICRELHERGELERREHRWSEPQGPWQPFRTLRRVQYRAAGLTPALLLEVLQRHQYTWDRCPSCHGTPMADRHRGGHRPECDWVAVVNELEEQAEAEDAAVR